MLDRQDAIMEQIRIISERFALQLPQKIADFRAAYARVSAAPHDAGALRELHGLAHRMTGAAATFGFPELSVAARLVEQPLRAILDTNAPPAPAELVRLDGVVQAFLACASGNSTPCAHELPALGASPPRILLCLPGAPELQAELSVQLVQFGYQVETVAHREAIAHTERPAAIVATLPEDAEAAREVGRHAQVPVVYVSACGDLPSRLLATRAGGKAFFVLPLDTHALIDKLNVLTHLKPQEPYRVLLVDDSPLEATMHALMFEGMGIETRVVTDPMQVMAPLAEFRPELILMDLVMPGCTGLDLAAAIRQQDAYDSIPIVFLTADASAEKHLAALELGGDDYLLKPLRAEHVSVSVLSRLQRARLLRTYMTRDSLTGLYNHTHLQEQLELALARARRHGGLFAFAMVDLDRFKSVNDTHGHLAGDRVIKSLATLLKQRLRNTDLIGRYGGEEFAVILGGVDAAGAVQVLDEIRRAFEGLRHRTADGGEFAVTLSAGVAAYPGHGELSELIEAADRALYRAKEQGRNRILSTSP